jgi:hypothetical protein
MCPPHSYRPAPPPPDAASVFALVISGPYSRVGAAPDGARLPLDLRDDSPPASGSGGNRDREE